MKVKGEKVISFLLYILIFINMFQELLYSYTNKASFLFYVTDCLLFLMCMASLLFVDSNNINKLQLFLWCLFFAYACFSLVWSNRDWYSIFFRLRYFMQGILILYFTQKYLTSSVYKKIINFLCIIQTLNLTFSFYQNRVMGLSPDFCNGLFGFIGYGSGTVGLFSLALSILAVIYYLSGDWKIVKTIYVIGISASFCAFAEVKVYYVVFAISVCLVFLLQKHSTSEMLRNLISFTFIVLLFYIAYLILKVVLPNNLETLFNINDYVAYDSRSTYAGRLNTIPFIYKNQFFNKALPALIGSGLGSSSKLYIYELGKTFSDLGFIGVGLLIAAIITPFCQYIVLSINNKTPEKLFVAIFSFVTLISIVVWNIPFVRVGSVICFFFLGIANVKWKNRGVNK